MTKKTDEKALSTQVASFDLTTPGGGIALDPEIANAINADDLEGYEDADDVLPIVSIQQKDLKDDKSGKTIFFAGGFHMYDAVTESRGESVPDFSGETGLIVTILKDQAARVMWVRPFDPAADSLCKSVDGRTGIGDPGGNCAICPHSQFLNGERPRCDQQRYLLVYDHALKTCYALRFGPSGLKPYGLFKTLVKRQAVDGKPLPLSVLAIKVTTRYEAGGKAPYYAPQLEVVNVLPPDLFNEMRQIRSELARKFTSTVQVDESDDEHSQNGSAAPGRDSGGELPPGVQPVDNERPDDINPNEEQARADAQNDPKFM